MLSIGIVGLAAVLVIVISFTHKGRGDRSKLLRYAALTMFVSAVLREAAPMPGHAPIVDLLKRVVFLGTEISAALLVLTFRPGSIAKRTARRFWAAGAAIALIETGLFVVQTGTHGMVDSYHEAVGHPAALAYFGLYETTIIATALIVGSGCWSALMRSGQPIVARVSLLLIAMAAVTTAGYVAMGSLVLIGRDADNDTARQALFLATIGLLLVGLAIGGLRKIVISGKQAIEAIAVDAATDIVEPLWQTAVKLHPNVVLQGTEFSKNERLERLFRLVVETHDALNFIRRDPDEALDDIRKRYTYEPQLTAGLLMHLLGEDNMPGRPSKWACAWRLLRFESQMPDQALMASIADIYAIRWACAFRKEWWIPARLAPPETHL
ncbi:hypothetical protein [Streptomyces sp. NRRL F-5053]|uniref:hypothetical protein n=1 Tax=Streptomyces sp. NRRL F-5053 TaxID=1463854 RepID=UPI0004CB3BAF|nr:hypothetical protein [Streptomyces sp. NRRL F-5053]